MFAVGNVKCADTFLLYRKMYSNKGVLPRDTGVKLQLYDCELSQKNSF